MKYLKSSNLFKISYLLLVFILMLSCGKNSNKIETKTTSARFTPKIPYENAMAKADSLVKLMTTEEKIRLIGGTKYFYTHGVERLGIDSLYLVDGTMGVNLRHEYMEAIYNNPIDSTTAFPAAMALAATWNTKLAYHYAKSIGEQCRAVGAHVLLAPGFNIYRHAQSGRNYEYFGEDPYLISRIIEQYVVGVQETGVVATLKHFVANNTDHYRRQSNSIVSERALHEIYMPAFKAGINAGALAVMTAYNQLNGQWCGQSPYVIDTLLQQQLGFKWLVMTDWWSVYDGEKVIKSGQHLEMPSSDATANAQALLDSGLIEMEDIENMVKHLVGTSLAMDLYNLPQETQKYLSRFKEHEKVAIETAREGIVMLKNNNNVLPIMPDSAMKILLTGKFLDTVYKGGGAAVVEGYNNTTLSKAMKNTYGNNLIIREMPTDAEIQSADYIFLSVGTEDHEAWDRAFNLPEKEESFIKKVVGLNPNTVVLANSGGGFNMSGWNDDAAAIVHSWYVGQNGYTALAEIVSGKVNPSGKLPITIEKSFDDSPGAGYLPEGHQLYTGWNQAYQGKEKDVYDIVYDEGVLVGYRWYDTKEIEPLYPFGHGLSYTSFEYSSLTLSDTLLKGQDQLKISCSITNTGSLTGKEIAQLYIKDNNASVLRPLKELKGFQKIQLKPGESKTVEWVIDLNHLAFWHPDTKKWTTEEGRFDVLVGTSSKNLPLRGTFKYLQ